MCGARWGEVGVVGATVCAYLLYKILTAAAAPGDNAHL